MTAKTTAKTTATATAKATAGLGLLEAAPGPGPDEMEGAVGAPPGAMKNAQAGGLRII